MAVWPEKFKVLRDNFKEELGNRVLSSSMDVGPAKKRRRTMLVSTYLTFSVLVENVDYSEFKKFYFDNDVGIIEFKRPDSNEVVKCRFASAPTPSFNETVWTIGVNLEVLP